MRFLPNYFGHLLLLLRRWRKKVALIECRAPEMTQGKDTPIVSEEP